MPRKSFSKTELQLLVSEEETDNLLKIQDTLYDTSRWSVHYNLIFQDRTTELFYETQYSVGATEYQDSWPFEDDGELIDCAQVEPVQVTVTHYKVIK